LRDLVDHREKRRDWGGQRGRGKRYE